MFKQKKLMERMADTMVEVLYPPKKKTSIKKAAVVGLAVVGFAVAAAGYIAQEGDPR